MRENNKNEWVDFLVAILLILAVPAVTFVGAVFQGWAISVLWGWFITPVFGLRVITIVEAIGLALFLGTIHPTYRAEKEGENKFAVIFGLLLTPILAVALGWIIKLFM